MCEDCEDTNDWSWETSCPKRADKTHCACWYEDETCCDCGAK